jgi:hypothetical protein
VVPNTGSAIITLVLNGAMYTQDVFNTATTPVEDQESTGTFVVSGSSPNSFLTSTQQDTTCFAALSPQDFNCLIVGGNLVLAQNGNDVGYMTNTAPPPSNAQQGCAVNGQWVPHMLSPQP